jgi:hypothetical protein
MDGKTSRKAFAKRDQFAPELLYFSDCIVNDREPEPSGEEGLQDVRIVEALYQSARSGRPVMIRPFRKTVRPTRRQRITRPGDQETDTRQSTERKQGLTESGSPLCWSFECRFASGPPAFRRVATEYSWPVSVVLGKLEKPGWARFGEATGPMRKVQVEGRSTVCQKPINGEPQASRHRAGAAPRIARFRSALEAFR